MSTRSGSRTGSTRGLKTAGNATKPGNDMSQEKNQQSDANSEASDLQNLSDTPPPGVDPVIYGLLVKINNTTLCTDKKIDDLQSKYDSLSDRYDSLEARCSDNEDQITSLRKDLSAVQYKVNVLHGRLMRSEAEKKRLSGELESLKGRSMNKNLIISFNKCDKYKEKKKENTLSVVNKFLKNELKINDTNSINITAAHRIGAERVDGRRSIIITVPSQSDMSKIMSNVKNLKDTGCFIDRQIPQSINERKRMCLPDFKEARAKGQKPVLREDKLYVNGELIRQHLPPTLPDIIDSPSEELDIRHGNHIDDSGSRFIGYAAEVSSLNHVREVLDSLLMDTEIASRSHVMYSYRIDDGNDSLIENFESDGDWGVGFNMLKFMKDNNIQNYVLVVTRDCSADFKHIGSDRMKHAIEVCKSVMDKFVVASD